MRVVLLCIAVLGFFVAVVVTDVGIYLPALLTVTLFASFAVSDRMAARRKARRSFHPGSGDVVVDRDVAE